MRFHVRFHTPEQEITMEANCAHELFEELQVLVPSKSFDIYSGKHDTFETLVFQWNGGNNS